jgi:uncharacterized protein YdeI (YjbR/CyaY-like superfamily)
MLNPKINNTQKFPSLRGGGEVDGVDSTPKWVKNSLFRYHTLPKNKSLETLSKKLKKAGVLSEVLLWNTFKSKKLMHNKGLAIVELAKKSGTWNALDDLENLILPKDLEEYLLLNKLLEKWNAKGRSFKRGFLEALLNTKRPETRQKKIQSLEL